MDNQACSEVELMPQPSAHNGIEHDHMSHEGYGQSPVRRMDRSTIANYQRIDISTGSNIAVQCSSSLPVPRKISRNDSGIIDASQGIGFKFGAVVAPKPITSILGGVTATSSKVTPSVSTSNEQKADVNNDERVVAYGNGPILQLRVADLANVPACSGQKPIPKASWSTFDPNITSCGISHEDADHELVQPLTAIFTGNASKATSHNDFESPQHREFMQDESAGNDYGEVTTRCLEASSPLVVGRGGNAIKPLLEARPRTSGSSFAPIIKIKKPSKTRIDSNHFTDSSSRLSVGPPTQEDLINILLFRNHQDKKKKAAEEAAHEAQGIKLRKAVEAYEGLEAQLEGLQLRYEAQTEKLKENEHLKSQTEKLQFDAQAQKEEVAKYAKIVPTWADKVKRLEEFVLDLLNSHLALSEGSKVLKNKCSTLEQEHIALTTMLRSSTEDAHNVGTRSSLVLARAHERLKYLEHECQAKTSAAKDQTDLLDHERGRNDEINKQLANMLQGQQQMIQTLAETWATTKQRFDEISATSNGSTTNILQNVGKLEIAIKNCALDLGILQSKPCIQTDDLVIFKQSVETHAAELNQYLERLHATAGSSKDEVQQIGRDVTQQIRALSISVEVGRKLALDFDQLQDAKLVMATELREKEIEFCDAKRRICELQGDRDRLQDESVTLKDELENHRARELKDSTLKSRIVELHTEKDVLREEISRLQSIVNELNDSIAKRDIDHTNVRHRLIDLQVQLDDANASSATAERQEVDFEKKLALQVEGVRGQLLEAANHERVEITNKYTNMLRDAHDRRESAETRSASLEENLRTVQRSYDKEVECTTLAKTDSLVHAKAVKEMEQQVCTLKTELEAAKSGMANMNRKIACFQEANFIAKDKSEKESAEAAEEIRKAKFKEDEWTSLINQHVRRLNRRSATASSLNSAIQLLLELERNTGRAALTRLDSLDQEDTQSNGKEFSESSNLGISQSVHHDTSKVPIFGGNAQATFAQAELLRSTNAAEETHNLTRNSEMPAPTARQAVTQDANSQVSEPESTKPLVRRSLMDITMDPLRTDTLPSRTPTPHYDVSFERIVDSISPVCNALDLFPSTPQAATNSSSPSERQVCNSSAKRIRGEGAGDHDARDIQTQICLNTQYKATDVLQDMNNSFNLPEEIINRNSASNDSTSKNPWPRRPPKKFAQEPNETGFSNKFKADNENEPEGADGNLVRESQFSRKSSLKEKLTSNQKRNVITAELDGNSSKSRKRVSKGETQDLGPVIGDSQSPARWDSKRSSIQTRKRQRRANQDKFASRFDEQLKEASKE